MNILIIPSWYVSKNKPNNGSFFREQAIALQKAGNDVTIINATVSSRKDYFSASNFRLVKSIDNGVQVYSYVTPAFGIGRFPKIYVRFFYFLLETLYKLLLKKGMKFDIIHAHSYYPAGYCASKLGKKYEIPVVVTEHASGVLNKNLTKYQADCLKTTVEISERFICVSEKLKTSVVDITKTEKKINVIPNMVSNIFKYTTRENPNDEFVFFSLGNLLPGKRFDLTIKSFSMTFKNRKNVKLYIGGSGPLSKKLYELINDTNMREQIELLGQMTRFEVSEKMQRSDVFVLNSDYETFGVVYIEALASGVPIIGTKNGGADAIINSHNGILVEKDNADQLSNAMEYIYRNIEKYDKNAISAQTIETYGENMIVSQLMESYKDLICTNEIAREMT